MKKAYKVTWISLASVVGVVLITVLIALYLVLSPKRLTSLVNKYAANFITCEYNIGKVDLTLFKSFPNVGLEIDDLVLINGSDKWESDTLAAIDECVVSLNLKKLMFEDAIIVNSCILSGGYINAYFDAEGNNNFDIFPPSEPEPEVEPETESTSYSIDLEKIKLNNINLRYADMASNTAASVKGLDLILKGNIKEELILADMDLHISNVTAEINDTTSIKTAIKQIAVNGKVKMAGDDINAKTVISTGALAFLMTGDSNIGANYSTLNVSYNGNVNNYNFIKGVTDLKVSGVTVAMDNETYIDNANISFNSPLQFDVEKFDANFEKSELQFNDIIIGFMGQLAMAGDDINLNMDVNTNTIVIGDAIKLIPQSMSEELLAGITVEGNLTLNTHIEGTYNEQSMPVVLADVDLNGGYVKMPEMLPYPLTNVNTAVHADLDLNGKSDVTLKSLGARMNKTVFAASGTVKDVMDKMNCNLSVKTDVDFNDVKSFMPEELIAKGTVKADINIKGTVDQFTNLDLMNTKLNGKLLCNNIDIKYCDTINLNTSELNLTFALPNPAENFLRDGLVCVKLKGKDLNADITNMMTAALDDFNIEAQVSNVLDSTAVLAAATDYGFNKIDFVMDDMELHSNNVNGSAFLLPSLIEGNVYYAAVYSSDSLSFAMGEDMYFATEALSLDVNADYNEKAENILLQWNPKLNLDLNNAVFAMKDLSEKVIIPQIVMTYNEEGLNIENSRIELGNSDFNLDGTITNIYDHFKNDELLTGELSFKSDYTDVNQLMDIFSGMGAEEEAETAQNNNAADSTAVSEGDPFMVPYGVDIKLHTLVNNATAGNMEIHNVGGDLTIKDGILVLQEMGFTSEAAKMQLTALYKSKRKNHLYAGFDFHLLDIDIAEMIKIIPDLDTIVPMLKSFAGNAEFHFAAETNLKADYSLKYSTLKAACSIEGKDLVVLDSETFNRIKKLLLFSKKTDNKIDTLDVQFTVFKNEIDVYPFAISMDKYSAMLYGRHNLDMSYDYNIAVLSPPILSRLGVEIKGPDFDNMKFKVRRSKHRNMFKPEKRDYKEEKIAEIKKIISNSLKENVKK
ncbi:MAG: hypothetical protein II817_04940 [Bacteroidales bacterium]|nr:hypothetical protein [Bacteroidales bacterium]